MILLEEKATEEDVYVEEILLEEGEVDTTKVIDPIFIVPIAKIMGHMKHMTTKFHGIRLNKRDKIKKRIKEKLQN